MTSQATASFTPQPTLPNPARAPEVLNLLLRLVNLSLSLGLNETALFIAERYSCLCPLSEEAAFLHALSLSRNNESRQALELLKSTIVEPPPLLRAPASSSSNTSTRRPACEASVRCAWVYADACQWLGRPNEGMECLKRAFMIYGNDNISFPDYACFGKPQAGIGNSSRVCVQLSLAKLAQQANKPEIAAQRYQEALRSAWWCWEAYEGLCQLANPADPEEFFAPVPVPIVQDPIDRQQDPPPASFLAAPPMDLRHSNRRSGSSQGGGSRSNIASSHIQPDQRSNSISSQSSFFRTSTPSFQFGNGQPFFGNGQNHAAATSTPVESQGAAFRFGEASDGVEEEDFDIRRIRPRSREPSAGPRLSISIEDGQGAGDESSFWNPNAARRTKPQPGSSNGGGLFGFTAAAKSAPLFGQGLLFGQTATAKNEMTRNGNASSSSSTGGFFTPVNAQNGAETPEAGQAGIATRLPVNGRPAPAAKRTINQIDETAPDESFGFQFHQSKERRHQGGPMSANGLGMNGNSAEAEEILVDDGYYGTGLRQDGAAGVSRPGYIKNNSQLNENLTRRGMANHTPLDTSAAGGNFAAKANRIVSNPREKKRTKAGPSSYDDASTATTASSSHSIDTNSALYAASSSSPPPVQSENEPHGYALPSLPMRSSNAEAVSSRPMTTPVFHKSVPLPSTALPVSQPLEPAPTADREMSYRKQLEAAQDALAENWLRGIYMTFAKATRHMSKFECPGAIKAVLSMPKEQRNSARAVLILGEAYYENLEYSKAEKAFVTLRELAPFAPDGLDVYSTLLWHLHRPTHLSYLAQDLIELSPTQPYAWIATGNVFSHLEDHANALKCFKRAIQCDSAFPYAYTLAGHESVTMDEWDVAIGFFREAIRRQPRHYNAWFGLGNVYMKTGKFRMAEYHFRKAVEINSSNAMLVCCVGTVLEKLDRKKEALEMYERACLLAPTSPAVRFKRVRMLMELKHFDSALRDLMLVRDMAPDEFNVHYLLGKLYGAMGDKVNMTRNLTIAQDLEPRAAGRIREIIEHAGQSSEGESEGEDEGDEGDDETRAGDRSDENGSLLENGENDADMG